MKVSYEKINPLNRSKELYSHEMKDNTGDFIYSVKDLSSLNNNLAGNFLSKFGGYNNLSERFSIDSPANNMKPKQHKRKENYLNELIDDVYKGSLKPSGDLSGNLITLIDKELNNLKSKNDDFFSIIESQKRKILRPCEIHMQSTGKQTEPTLYNSYNPERIDLIKQEANLEAEYNNSINLDELQKIKSEHESKMLDIENDYFIRKRHGEDNNPFKAQHDQEYKFLNDSHKLTSDDLKRIIKHEEEYIMSYKNDNKTFKMRAKTAKAIKRAGGDGPISPQEQKYVKKYMSYLVKNNVENEQMYNSFENWWNTTKIKSQHTEGKVNRKDGLTGYIDTNDKSAYYINISVDSPKSLNLSRSISRSKSRPKIRNDSPTMSRSKSFVMGQKTKSSTNDQDKLNSHIAFIKLIFNILRKNEPYVSKEDIFNNMKLEENILYDLGFDNYEEFVHKLNILKTEKECYMAEHEMIGFILSHNELGEQYLINYQNDEDNNFKEENGYDFDYNNNGEGEIDYNNLNHMEFLQGKNTHERLNNLKSSICYSQKDFSKTRDFNSNLTYDLKNKIKSDNNVKVTYKDYLDFTKKYKTKKQLKFTIPKLFEFAKRNDHAKKLHKIETILEERKKKEEEFLNYKFRSNDLKREMFISSLGNIIEAEKAKRKYRTEKLKEKIIQEMRPFSFYEQDEAKYKLKIQQEGQAPEFLPFKANPIPWKSQITMLEDIVKRDELQRQMRIEERARQTYQTAKLPPRMEMHEKKKKMQEQELKILSESKITKRSKSSFKAKDVPNFSVKQEKFYKALENKKAIAKPTVPIPFAFHEPKKKASLHGFLDVENDPNVKNPQFKKNITDIIHRIQQKPKIEPASTKSLNLLMATRRKELEDKQKKEEQKILEEKERKEKQNRLKERVVNSKNLVDNTKSLEEKRKKQQDDFKNNLKDTAEKYQQELARRLQKVNNRPLMFESVTQKNDKFSKDREMMEKIQNVEYYEEDHEIKV